MRKGVLLFILMFLIFSFSYGETDLKSGDKAMIFNSSYDKTEQPYRLYIPTTYDKSRQYPLLVVLHGKWVNQNAWFDYTPVKEHAEKRGYIVAAPFGRGDYFYRGAAEQDVLDIISEIKKAYNIDNKRVYLIGHSMGGWGTWWIGLRNQDLFATICPMAGMTPADLLPNAELLDPFIIHDADDPIVNVKNSRKPVSIFGKLGVSFRYKEEHGYGHASKMIGDNFENLFDWFDAHQINDKPDRIKIVTRTPAKGKAYWVSIIETRNFPKYASIEARIDKGENKQTIKIATDNVKRLALWLDTCPIDKTVEFVIEVDDVLVKDINKKDDLIILCKESVDISWRPAKKEYEKNLNYANPVISMIPKNSDIASSATLLTSAASGLLCKEIGADLCLFNHDVFMSPAGDLTVDAILDLYVYPEEKICMFEYKGEIIPKFLTIQPQFFPTGKFDEDGLKSGKIESYKVISSIEMAEKIGISYNPLPDTVGEYLLKAVKNNNGKFGE